jgi:N-acyl homoserine lactone hydrolase
MKLIPLEIGRIDANLVELAGRPGRAILPVPAWLIEHPRGLVLFDTGLHTDLRSNDSRLRAAFGSTTLDFPVGEELSARIGAVGHSPDDIDVIVFSHLHFDHCGGTREVPNARIVIQAAEWKAAHHPRLIEVGLYDPTDFDLGHAHQLIEGTFDVFGDGKVVCLPTPGHTKGHQSLRVELGSGPVVLTADCVYFRAMLDEMQVPPFGADRDQQLESMRELARLQQEGCRLLYGHDIEQFRSLSPTGLT